MVRKSDKLTELGGDTPTNGGAVTIDLTLPYVVTFEIKGVCEMLFHRYNCESVEVKGKAAKGSAAKKTDDVESYVFRNDADDLCLPGEYVRQSMIHAAKYKQDPRSPRKSAMDLFKAAVISLTPLASLGTKEWEFEDKRRVGIMRSAVTRTRPAMKTGWTATFQFMVNLPEYVNPDLFHEVLVNAGRLIGVADFRPTYGRFVVTSFVVGLDQ